MRFFKKRVSVLHYRNEIADLLSGKTAYGGIVCHAIRHDPFQGAMLVASPDSIITINGFKGS
jgi:hypothetical protein